MQQTGAASSPLALGDLPSIKKEMKALEAEVSHQHVEMDEDRAEIERLERMQVRRAPAALLHNNSESRKREQIHAEIGGQGKRGAPHLIALNTFIHFIHSTRYNIS